MDYTGMKVLVMGLGLNGGGYEAALYFYKRGATLTVTDLKDEAALAPTIEKLDAACREIKAAGAIRYVLGRHELDDFKAADLTIKNPGARPDSPFLQAAKKIETDISVFLAACPARIFAVTGSKGKSTTSAALHWILQKIREEGAPAFPGRAYLGGNIAISPLSFLDELDEDDDVVLELSSFQLGDLRGRRDSAGRALLKPKVSVITCIMKDHLDRYGTMENYVADKKVIYAGQDEGDIAVTKDDEWGQVFRGESRARQLIHAGSPLEKGISGGWAGGEGPGFARLYRGGGFKGGGETAELVPARPLTPGAHQKRNLLAAALGVYALGADAAAIKNALKNFAGVEHRLEFFCEWENNRFYNDSAATIPEAAAAAVNALAGGDRKL
ncbi:MAG: UDP-N-acetylmuramoyl-L-alanine--D-glutamate ligase, partial [Spirochaetes bacterium]|nr:UDP-N-acetylmuramoyl-L-alanine--D-glutamate ligase [Spirochaetota bacterium]